MREVRRRTIQTLFGTVEVDAPQFGRCRCSADAGANRRSPVCDLLPERCTRELRAIQAELAARHSFRGAARLLTWLLPCSPPNHATVRSRLHGVAAEIEAAAAAAVPDGVVTTDPPDEPGREAPVVMIDGAHIPAVPGLQGRCVDVTVGKVEM